MKATVVDLRHKMKDVFRALKRSERVEILYHGKPAGIIMPVLPTKKRGFRVEDHPVFGMDKRLKDTRSVNEKMDVLRGPRFA